MRKVTLALMFVFSFSLSTQSAEVEKLMSSPDIKLIEKGPLGVGPLTLVVDEVERTLLISEFVTEKAAKFFYLEPDRKSEIVAFPTTGMEYFHRLGNYFIGSKDLGLLIREENTNKTYLREKNIISGGLSFILKRADGHYLVFFVNDSGALGAADTTGKVYSSQEALSALKTLDPEKFERSRNRAKELGLEQQFLSGKALVWGDTYYDTPKRLEAYWGHWVYPLSSEQVQYDQQGYGYQINFSTAPPRNDAVRGAIVRCIDSNGNEVVKQEFSSSSQIIPVYNQGQFFKTSVYVGFGGNIYFYVAGEDFTEIFRIRRTWGAPDFYAMAINGYTDDGYGKYVKQTLAKLSKEDLRLLRNHLFALYGYVFQSKDLAGYFDKQVWYQPKAEATTGGIESALPAERRALLDLVKAEESKR